METDITGQAKGTKVNLVSRDRPLTRPQPVFFPNAFGTLRLVNIEEVAAAGAVCAAKTLAALAVQGDNVEI